MQSHYFYFDEPLKKGPLRNGFKLPIQPSQKARKIIKSAALNIQDIRVSVPQIVAGIWPKGDVPYQLGIMRDPKKDKDKNSLLFMSTVEVSVLCVSCT